MLDVKNISKSFGSTRAVDGLSFQAKPGSIFGLLGPNGAGKTTTIRMVLDILAPDSGEVHWAGRRVDASVRHTFGYLPEERGLYPNMKVDAQLQFFANLHGVDSATAKARMAKLAADFNLTENLKKAPRELSKGNQQKVQFMAAILHDPPLLILDEPFSGFDPINLEVVKDTIRELEARGTTIMLSSHRMEQVEELCNDIVLIDKARAVLSGNLKTIKRTWPDRFIRMTNVADKSFLAAFAGVEQRPAKDGDLTLALAPNTKPADILKAAVAANQVDHFEIVEPSLNDIYLHYVTSGGPGDA